MGGWVFLDFCFCIVDFVVVIVPFHRLLLSSAWDRGSWGVLFLVIGWSDGWWAGGIPSTILVVVLLCCRVVDFVDFVHVGFVDVDVDVNSVDVDFFDVDVALFHRPVFLSFFFFQKFGLEVLGALWLFGYGLVGGCWWVGKFRVVIFV